MKSKSPKRGRPSLGLATRRRATFTLSRESLSLLATQARETGLSRSRILENAIRQSPPSSRPYSLAPGALKALCERRGIQELWLFGSALRPDFSEQSDIDLLIRFKPGACRSYFDFVETQQDLEALFKRKVDLVEEQLLDNPLRRAEILSHRERLYAA